MPAEAGFILEPNFDALVRVLLLDVLDKKGALCAAVAGAPWSRLSASSGGAGAPATHVYGVAMHDTYHAGQIRTIKAIYKRAAAARTRKRKR